MAQPDLELTDVTQQALQGQGLDPLSEVPDDLVCSICLHPAFGGVTTPCEHIFHEVCLRSALRDRKECPSCRSATQPSGEPSFKPIGRVLSNMLAAYKVRCPQGCCFPVPWEDLKKHIEIHCPNTRFRCPYDGCTADAKVRAEFFQHVDQCEHAVISCQCSQQMKRRDLESHKASICSKTLVVCGFCKTEGIERGALETHLRESCNASTMISLVKPMQDTIHTLMEQVESLQAQTRQLESSLLSQCTRSYQVKLPSSIASLPVDDKGKYTATVGGHILQIYPKGNGVGKRSHISIFVGPTAPATMKYEITIGEACGLIEHTWEKPVPYADLRGKQEFIEIGLGEMQKIISLVVTNIDPDTIVVDLSR